MHQPVRRDLGFVALLSFVTLGLYGVYWVARLGEDVNAVLGREKYRFGLILLLGIVTIGIASCVYEILFAYDLQKSQRYQRLALQPKRNLGGTVVALDLIAIAVSLATAGLGFVVSVIIGVWATWLIQDAINQVASADPPVPQGIA